MKDSSFDDRFTKAIDTLKSRPDAPDLSRFEQHVWSEIALRERPHPFIEWLQGGGLLMPLPATVVLTLLAITSGSLLALSQADAYDRKAERFWEERYVQSIHPVLMSRDNAP